MADAPPRTADLEFPADPRELRLLDRAALDELAAGIRDRLVDRVSRTGGHLGPNLGVVELTLAIHRVFDSPADRILFDTGHQAYVHKMVTGRAGAFDGLRRSGGLSGYPSAAESEHDIIENSHASTALSYADGLTKAYVLTGRTDRHVVAIVGDGALTGGMAWEALNNIAAAKAPNLVIVVNDNGRSYAPTVGGLAERLDALRTAPQYEKVLRTGEQALRGIPLVGELAYRAAHGAKAGFKDFTNPQRLFGDLGLKYLGPVDGHDVEAVEHALRRAKDFAEPVIVHCVTRKGAGYGPAENDAADCFHGIGVIDPVTGKSSAKSAPTWTSVFADELVRIGAERPDVVAITAAMLRPVGLERFAAAFPDRVFDVGIAEQHAVTSAVGLAIGGLHPVVAVYATFLNRAFDQVLMDAALHRRGVTLVLDRAGVTGEDGPSHNGMWDTALLQVVPGLRLAAPRDPASLRARLREAVQVQDAPTVVRFPKASTGPDIQAVDRLGGVEILARGESEDVLLVSVGALARTCLQAAARLTEAGLGVTVVDPCWAKPLDAALIELAQRHRLVVTVEDGVRTGGVGAALAQLLRDAEVFVPQREFGIPARFLDQGTRQEVLQALGLSAAELAAEISALHARIVKNEHDAPLAPVPVPAAIGQ